MAKAEVKVVERTEMRPVVVGTTKTIVLELTEEEAITLRTVTGAILGSYTNSRRRHTNIIFLALRELGLPGATYSGTITFPDSAVKD